MRRRVIGDSGGSSLRRWRLPGGALVEVEFGCGLTEKIPVRHRLGIILPGGESAGRGDRVPE